MRTIDADALKEQAEIVPLTFDGGIDINDFEKMLDEMPTVEAIPIEWINKYANEHRAYIHAFAEMVACWYDEKEKREYEMASDMRDYCKKYEPTYNPEDGSL